MSAVSDRLSRAWQAGQRAYDRDPHQRFNHAAIAVIAPIVHTEVLVILAERDIVPTEEQSTTLFWLCSWDRPAVAHVVELIVGTS